MFFRYLPGKRFGSYNATKTSAQNKNPCHDVFLIFSSAFAARASSIRVAFTKAFPAVAVFYPRDPGSKDLLSDYAGLACAASSRSPNY